MNIGLGICRPFADQLPKTSCLQIIEVKNPTDNIDSANQIGLIKQPFSQKTPLPYSFINLARRIDKTERYTAELADFCIESIDSFFIITPKKFLLL